MLRLRPAGCRVERGVVDQDPLFEIAQMSRRPQTLSHPLSEVPVREQCIGLTLLPVESSHEAGGEPRAQRVRLDQTHDLGGQRPIIAQCQACLPQTCRSGPESGG